MSVVSSQLKQSAIETERTSALPELPKVVVPPIARQLQVMEHAIAILNQELPKYKEIGAMVSKGEISSLDQLKDLIKKKEYEDLPLYKVIFALVTVPGLVIENRTPTYQELDRLLATEGSKILIPTVSKAATLLISQAIDELDIKLNREQIAEIRGELSQHPIFLPLRRWTAECTSAFSQRETLPLTLAFDQTLPFVALEHLPWINQRAFRILHRAAVEKFGSRTDIKLKIEMKDDLITLDIESVKDQQSSPFCKSVLGFYNSRKSTFRLLKPIEDHRFATKETRALIENLKRCNQGSGALTHLLFGYGPIDYDELFGKRSIIVASPPYIDLTSNVFGGDLKDRRLILPIDVVQDNIRDIAITVSQMAREQFVKNGTFKGCSVQLWGFETNSDIRHTIGTLQIESVSNKGTKFILRLGNGYQEINSLGSRQREGAAIRTWLLEKVAEPLDDHEKMPVLAKTIAVSRFPDRPELSLAGLKFDLGKSWANENVKPVLIQWQGSRYIGFQYPLDQDGIRPRKLFGIKSEEGKFVPFEVNSVALGKWR